MRNIQLILCDLDGTLLNDNKEMDTDFVKSCKNIPFTLVSGRNQAIMQDFVNQCNLKLPYITNNGANIYVKDQCIYEKAIETKELKTALDLLQKQDVSFIAYSSKVLYRHGKNEKMDFFAKRLEGHCEICTYQGQELSSIFKVVMIHKDLTLMKELCQAINDLCPNSIAIRSEGYVHTLTHREATKGKAIQFLLRFLELSPECVLAFGDNYNDISMFENVGYSVAMQNASQDVKEKAMYVTLSNNEQGVSRFLEENLE